jgi:hypothetical protein
MEVKTMDDKKLAAMLNLLTYDNNLDKAIEATGVPREIFLDWYRDDEFRTELHTRKRLIVKNVVREPSPIEPLRQMLDNIGIDILPLLYNFDSEDDDEAIKKFVDDYNIYAPQHSLGERIWIPNFKRRLTMLKTIVDKHLAKEPLTEEEERECKWAYEGQHIKAGIIYGQPDGTARRYDKQINEGSINFRRVYSELYEVITGKKTIRRCEASDCNKIFIPRDTGGHPQRFHEKKCQWRESKRQKEWLPS